MKIEDILDTDRVICNPDICSKKKVLELLSATLSDDHFTLSSKDIFECLLNREKLGSTTLGEGVALPHGRCDNLETATLAVVKLSKGIDFDATDGQKVDIFLGLIVPDAANEQHLEILSMLAEMLADKNLVASLRSTSTSTMLYKLLTEWKAPDTSTDAA